MAPPAGSGGLGPSGEDVLCFRDWRCLWDIQWRFPVGSWKRQVGTRARAADIRKEERKRLMLYRTSLSFTQSSLGRNRECAFRKKMNWVKVMV